MTALVNPIAVDDGFRTRKFCAALPRAVAVRFDIDELGSFKMDFVFWGPVLEKYLDERKAR